MTKHEVARRLARGADPVSLKRRRRNWLAKMHRRAIAAALARKERADGV